MKYFLIPILALSVFSCTTFVNGFPPQTIAYDRDWKIELISESSALIKVYKINEEYYALEVGSKANIGSEFSLYDLETALIIGTKDRDKIVDTIDKIEVAFSSTVGEKDSFIIDLIIVEKQLTSNISESTFTSVYGTYSSTEVRTGNVVLFRLQALPNYMGMHSKDSMSIMLLLKGQEMDVSMIDLKALREAIVK